MKLALFTFTVFLIITASPMASYLEASMLLHVLIQIPVLAVIGYVCGKILLKELVVTSLLEKYNDKGIPGILLASLALAFWMLPRMLDSSLNEPFWAITKYTSIPLLIGLPIALSWPQMGSITRGLIKIEFLTMLFRLSWIYIVSPVRLCNLYQLNEQILLGKSLLVLAFLIAFIWIIELFSQKAPSIEMPFKGVNLE